MAVAAAATAFALSLGDVETAGFTVSYACGWLMHYQFFICVYPAIQEVVEPRLRATAMGLYFACLFFIGSALGPLGVGMLSDHFARSAMLAAGESGMTAAFRAAGLHAAMYLVPAALALAAINLVAASFTVRADAKAMRADQQPLRPA